ncbi:MAG: hypothetical protein NVS2B7_18430 [Herpetosiphon sp.]
MPTLKYLMVVAAVLAAAFFLARPETGLPTNSYADVMPAAMSSLPMLSPKSWSDDWYQVHKTAREEFVIVSSF